MIQSAIAIKFPAQEGVMPAKISRRTSKHFEEEILSRVPEFAWNKQFVEDREHVENESHDGQRLNYVKDNNIIRVKQLFEGDRCLTIIWIVN